MEEGTDALADRRRGGRAAASSTRSSSPTRTSRRSAPPRARCRCARSPTRRPPSGSASPQDEVLAGSSRCASAAGCAASPRSSTTAAPASRANGMGVWAVPEDEILETGQRMAAFRGISHCYQRPTYADWPYSVFTMAHGRSKEECDAVLDSIAEPTGISERATLYSSTEFKKVRMLYFTDDFQRWEAGARGADAPRSTDTRSAELYRRALHVLPGGVNSPVRAMRSIGRDPIFIERAEGAEITDVDGNTYVDYVCSWGPLIHGHAHPAVLEAVAEAAAPRDDASARRPRARSSWPSSSRARMPSVDMLRMTSSGTEASMSAIRLARAATGPREAAQVRRRLPRPRRRAARRGGLGPRDAGHPRLAGRAGGRGRRDRRRAVERRRTRCAPRSPSTSSPPCWPSPTRPTWASSRPRRGFLELLRELRDRARRAARLRRGHHRLPGRARRRAGADRRARPT